MTSVATMVNGSRVSGTNTNMKKVLTLVVFASIISFSLAPAASAIIVGGQLEDNDPEVNQLFEQVKNLVTIVLQLQQAYLARQQAQNPYSQIMLLLSSNSLSFGDRGDAVKQLQQLLNQATGSSLPLTGYFGPMTQSALGQLQNQITSGVGGLVPAGNTSGFGGLLTEMTRSLSATDTLTAGTQTMLDPSGKFTASVTAYCPFNTTNTRLEGGQLDERDAKLQTLHQYVNQQRYPGGGIFVGVALDSALRSQGFAYGQRLRIPYFEQTYNGGKFIDFRVVDNGGDFNNRGSNPPDKVDVAVSDESMCTGFKKTLDIYKVSAPALPPSTSGFGSS
jgi:hypothetical protein